MEKLEEKKKVASLTALLLDRSVLSARDTHTKQDGPDRTGQNGRVAGGVRGER